ncbi:MAG: DNA methyltransferase, partial [Chloroflexota bacterium]
MRLPFQTEAVSSLEAERLQIEYGTDGVTTCDARIALELKYTELFHQSKFNRKLVSYQGNKNTKLHNWLKYKEGFSAQLVENLLDDFGLTPGQKILDPFAGSATTLLVAQTKGLNAVGIEILPVCHLAWEAKSNYPHYNLAAMLEIQTWLQTTTAGLGEIPFPHIPITESAFPEDQEQKLMWYAGQLDTLISDEKIKNLLRLMLMSILEDISFTRKDGQYLRWDSRSTKAQQRDQRRIDADKAPYKTFFKGELSDISDELLQAFNRILFDIKTMQNDVIEPAEQQLIEGSALKVMPSLEPNQFDSVITSPPYCNRYDYTRTYALELAFLGLTHQDVIDLRQEQLSCTVENRSKLDQL